jgi:lysophospholipase L1-like esterase
MKRAILKKEMKMKINTTAIAVLIVLMLTLVFENILATDEINMSLLDIHGFKYELTTTSDSVLGYRLKNRFEMRSNSLYGFRHNNYGFIGPDFKLSKQKDTLRIICLGGSTTYGAGVETEKYSYPCILQQIFNRVGHGANKIEIINAGVFGYNSVHTYLRVSRRLDLFDANLYIIMDGLNDLDLSQHLVRQHGSGSGGLEKEFEYIGYRKNIQKSIQYAKNEGIQTVLVSDPMQIDKNMRESTLIKNNDLREVLKFGRSVLPQINERLARINGIQFVNSQEVFDDALKDDSIIRRVWADDLHLTRYGYYLLARSVYRHLMTMPAIQCAVGTNNGATDVELDALFPELVLWRPADGIGWTTDQGTRTPGEIETINVNELMPTENGWSFYAPKDPETPAILSMAVKPGSTIRIYPRIESASDRVDAIWLSSDGQQKLLFKLDKPVEDGHWTPESAWYRISIPEGKEGRLKIQLVGHNAQLWHKGKAVLFQGD